MFVDLVIFATNGTLNLIHDEKMVVFGCIDDYNCFL